MAYAQLLALGDERVMQELQAANTDAFAVVFKRYHRLVHVVALQILRDASEARRRMIVWFDEHLKKLQNTKAQSPSN